MWEDAHHSLLVLGSEEAAEVGPTSEDIDVGDSNLAISGSSEETDD